MCTEMVYIYILNKYIWDTHVTIIRLFLKSYGAMERSAYATVAMQLVILCTATRRTRLGDGFEVWVPARLQWLDIDLGAIIRYHSYCDILWLNTSVYVRGWVVMILCSLHQWFISNLETTSGDTSKSCYHHLSEFTGQEPPCPRSQQHNVSFSVFGKANPMHSQS